jgi:hypothetical protein
MAALLSRSRAAHDRPPSGDQNPGARAISRPEEMTATQGFITSGLLILLGIGGLMAALRARAAAVIKGLAVVFGTLLCGAGLFWLLLSIAAYRGVS